jgi:hypothetical protein
MYLLQEPAPEQNLLFDELLFFCEARRGFTEVRSDGLITWDLKAGLERALRVGRSVAPKTITPKTWDG